MKKNEKKNEKDVAELRNDDLLREDVLMAALAEAGLSAEGTVAERATTLEAYYLEQTPPVGWDEKPVAKGGKGAWHLQCMIEAGGCGYHSIATRPYCDFCGDGQGEVSGVSPSTAMTVATAPTTPVIDGELIEHEEGIPQPGDPEGTVADLDAAIAVINEAKRALDAGERVVTGYEWDLGRVIFDVYRRALYVQRKKDGGAPLYSSWPQFCKAELGGLSGATVNRYMRIAVNFPRELACELGPSKLAELLPAAEAQAAEDQRAARLGSAPKLILPPLLDRARVVQVADLRVEVKAALPAPPPREGRTAKATEAAAKKKNAEAKKPEVERVTVQRQEGSIKLKFYQSEEAARAHDKAKVAKKWREGIVAIEPAVNGVECVYQTKEDGKLGLVLHRKVIRVDG